jgi:GntR family transcriptional repressor for pyruvate dehydrogenase complex
MPDMTTNAATEPGSRHRPACSLHGRSLANLRPFVGTPFQPVHQRRAFEEVIGQIEQVIASGRLGVGDRLPSERELASLLGVSRPSVREALRVFDAVGILKAQRGQGLESGSIVTAETGGGLATFFRLYTELLRIPLGDLIDVREALEVAAATAAATRPQPEHLEGLRAAVDRMRATETAEEFLLHDTEFHLALARASGNAAAPLLMDALRESIARYMLEAFALLADWPTERVRLIDEHQAIVQELEAGDAPAAGRAVSRHIRDFYTRVLDGRATGHSPESGTTLGARATAQ